jgi:(p)ppGpp synthase/HD superfamily hydrolase
VMGALRNEHERMAAVLHDVVEDTTVTLDDLTEAGCPAPVLAALAAISKQPGEAQESYLARVASNPIALAVKRADIKDNMSPDRMARLDKETQERLRAKYTSALRQLGA